MINCLVVLLLIVPLPFLPILPFPSTLPHLISLIIIIFNFSSFFFLSYLFSRGWWDGVVGEVSIHPLLLEEI